MAALLAVKTAGLALAMNYGVHVGSSVAYGYVCVPQSVGDIVRSFVTTASPICSFLLSTMQVTQGNFATIVTTTLAALAAGALKPAV